MRGELGDARPVRECEGSLTLREGSTKPGQLASMRGQSDGCEKGHRPSEEERRMVEQEHCVGGEELFARPGRHTSRGRGDTHRRPVGHISRGRGDTLRAV